MRNFSPSIYNFLSTFLGTPFSFPSLWIIYALVCQTESLTSMWLGQNDIRKNPAFRSQFHEMCANVGVDPLASNKGFWAELLGIGDFYYELGRYQTSDSLVMSLILIPERTWLHSLVWLVPSLHFPSHVWRSYFGCFSLDLIRNQSICLDRSTNCWYLLGH